MKIYISGPITNNPGYEKQFAEAEEKLLSMGHLVINPAKNPGTCYKDYLDIGLLELMNAMPSIYFRAGRYRRERNWRSIMLRRRA